MTPGTIFISHRAEYGNLVRELKKAIETTSRGQISVFISEDLPGAEKWRAAIKSSLQDAENFFSSMAQLTKIGLGASMRLASSLASIQQKNNLAQSIVSPDLMFRLPGR